MQSLGFIRAEGTTYYHEALNVFIGDAHAGNFIKRDGVIVPVDLMIHERR
jgi:hypothetical protein